MRTDLRHRLNANGQIWVGIDNGVSGSIGLVDNLSSHVFIPMPTRYEQDYTKHKKKVSRICAPVLYDILRPFVGQPHTAIVKVTLERPMVNPIRFYASASALRALESTLCVLESLGLPIEFIDSRTWQHVLLPAGVKGGDELKRVSMELGRRLFPECEREITRHGDADGLMIAEWTRRTR